MRGQKIIPARIWASIVLVLNSPYDWHVFLFIDNSLIKNNIDQSFKLYVTIMFRNHFLLTVTTIHKNVIFIFRYFFLHMVLVAKNKIIFKRFTIIFTAPTFSKIISFLLYTTSIAIATIVKPVLQLYNSWAK